MVSFKGMLSSVSQWIDSSLKISAEEVLMEKIGGTLNKWLFVYLIASAIDFAFRYDTERGLRHSFVDPRTGSILVETDSMLKAENRWHYLKTFGAVIVFTSSCIIASLIDVHIVSAIILCISTLLRLWRYVDAIEEMSKWFKNESETHFSVMKQNVSEHPIETRIKFVINAILIVSDVLLVLVTFNLSLILFWHYFGQKLSVCALSLSLLMATILVLYDFCWYCSHSVSNIEPLPSEEWFDSMDN